MRHFRLPASSSPLTLLACFGVLTCLNAASTLWTVNQFSPSSWLTVAAGQKFSPPADYFYAARWWVWLQLGALTCVAGALAWWLHAVHVAPLRTALASARRMARADLTAHLHSSDGLQNNELLSTMQEMNTCISEIIASARQQNDSIAGGASELARMGLQTLTRGAELASALARAAAAGQELAAAARLGGGAAQQVVMLAGQAAEAATRGAALATGIGEQLAEAGAGVHCLGAVRESLDTLAREGEALALRAALEAAHAGAASGSIAVLAAEVRALAARTGAAAHSVRQLAAQVQQHTGAASAQCAEAARWARAAGNSNARAQALAAALADTLAAQQTQVRPLVQALAASEQARGRVHALAEQSAATAAAVRDQAGALVRTLGRVTLAPEYGGSALIRLAHSSASPVPASARGTRAGAAHLISIL